MARTPEHEKWVPESKSWPAHVRPLSLDDEGLGIDDQGELYWKGRAVRTRRLDLTAQQTLLAWIVALATVVAAVAGVGQGLAAGHDFGCRMTWWARGCPSSAPPATPPQPGARS